MGTPASPSSGGVFISHRQGWMLENAILVLAASSLVGQFLQTFKDFPPRQKAASFTIDQAVAKLEASPTAGQ